jgi:hypothetical protein
MKPRRPSSSRSQSKPRQAFREASVSARFTSPDAARQFLVKLGMPDTLVSQLFTWLHDIPPGDTEEMRPELTWENKPTTLTLRATPDEDEDGLDLEFAGLPSLIEALQADLDEFFRPKQPKKGKR